MSLSFLKIKSCPQSFERLFGVKVFQFEEIMEKEAPFLEKESDWE